LRDQPVYQYHDKHPVRYLQLLETQLQVVLLISTPASAHKLARKRWHCCTSEKLSHCICIQVHLRILLTEPYRGKNGATMSRQLLAVKSQNCACPSAPRPSQHRRCTSVILSTGLQMPVQFQSKDAAHGFPACAFHSQSARSSKMGHEMCADYSEK